MPAYTLFARLPHFARSSTRSPSSSDTLNQRAGCTTGCAFSEAKRLRSEEDARQFDQEVSLNITLTALVANITAREDARASAELEFEDDRAATEATELAAAVNATALAAQAALNSMAADIRDEEDSRATQEEGDLVVRLGTLRADVLNVTAAADGQLDARLAVVEDQDRNATSLVQALRDETEAVSQQ